MPSSSDLEQMRLPLDVFFLIASMMDVQDIFCLCIVRKLLFITLCRGLTVISCFSVVSSQTCSYLYDNLYPNRAIWFSALSQIIGEVQAVPNSLPSHDKSPVEVMRHLATRQQRLLHFILLPEKRKSAWHPTVSLPLSRSEIFLDYSSLNWQLNFELRIGSSLSPALLPGGRWYLDIGEYIALSTGDDFSGIICWDLLAESNKSGPLPPTAAIVTSISCLSGWTQQLNVDSDDVIVLVCGTVNHQLHGSRW